MSEPTKEPYTYEGARNQLKLGPFTTCVMILKTTVGVGIFTFQYCYALCGIMWGTFLAVSVFFAIVYGMTQLIQVCDDIEEDENLKDLHPPVDLDPIDGTESIQVSNPEEMIEEDLAEKAKANLRRALDESIDVRGPSETRYQIITYHQIASKMEGKQSIILIFLSIFALMGMGLGFALGNYVYLIKALKDIFGVDIKLCSSGVFLICLMLLYIIVEPEKIKPLAYLLSIFIVGSASCLMFNNYFMYLLGRRAQHLIFMNTEPSGLLIGVSLFSFESINVVINVRRTTKDTTRMKKYIYTTFISAGVFFILFALSFHIIFGSFTIKKIAFDYFVKSSLLYKMKFLVALNALFSVPFNIIAITEIFEKLKAFNPIIRQADGDLSSTKIMLTRIALLIVLFILTLISTDISEIFDLVGAIFGPILGLILPIFFIETYYKQTKRPIGLHFRILNKVLYVIGLSFIYYGLSYAIYG